MVGNPLAVHPSAGARPSAGRPDGCPTALGCTGSEETKIARGHAPELVVVNLDPAQAAGLREHAGLRLHLLGDENPADLPERRVEAQPLDVPNELLDAIDLAAALDLDGDDPTG